MNTTPAMQSADQPKTITLDTPVNRGAEQITSVTITKPQAGTLRGIRLQALMDMDVNCLMTLLPRVTQPSLQPHEINALDPADLLSLSVEVVSFLLPKSALIDSPTN